VSCSPRTLVSVPSSSGARILSSRSMSHPVITRAYQLAHDAQQHLYRTPVAEARALMKTLDPTPNRDHVRSWLRSL
jgi:hypothetical protein